MEPRALLGKSSSKERPYTLLLVFTLEPLPFDLRVAVHDIAVRFNSKRGYPLVEFSSGMRDELRRSSIFSREIAEFEEQKGPLPRVLCYDFQNELPALMANA